MRISNWRDANRPGPLQTAQAFHKPPQRAWGPGRRINKCFRCPGGFVIDISRFWQHIAADKIHQLRSAADQLWFQRLTIDLLRFDKMAGLISGNMLSKWRYITHKTARTPESLVYKSTKPPGTLGQFVDGLVGLQRLWSVCVIVVTESQYAACSSGERAI